MAGVTPEAADLSSPELEPQIISRDDIDAYSARFERNDDGLDVVVFAAPQLSLMELQKLGALLSSKRIAAGVSLIATTSPEMKSAADRMGITGQIEEAGGIVLEGVCFYQMHARDLAQANGWHRLMTNSAKLTNIIAGYGYQPTVASMERCVASAIAGRMV